MQTRVYKDSGEKISLLGFGLMRLPQLDDDPAHIDMDASQQMFDYAIAHGVNYFDTAYVYHGGHSESAVKQLLKNYPRSSYNIATKMPPWSTASADILHRRFDKQLQKCGVDYFDYYLIHNISSATWPTIESVGFYELLLEKKRQGLIRHLGFSFHDTPAMLRDLLEKYEWDFAQIQLNYLDWELQDAKSQYEMLYQRGIPVIVMEPLRGGSLVTLNPEAVEIFKRADPQRSVASWGMRYAASLPGVLTILSGMNALDQVKDNIQTLSNLQTLSKEEYDTLELALNAYRKHSPIPCTACRYCMDCPSGVDIPRVFALYNQYQVEKVGFKYVDENIVMGKEHQASACTACNACMEHCPQSIDIPGWMHKIDTLYQELQEQNA